MLLKYTTTTGTRRAPLNLIASWKLAVRCRSVAITLNIKGQHFVWQTWELRITVFGLHEKEPSQRSAENYFSAACNPSNNERLECLTSNSDGKNAELSSRAGNILYSFSVCVSKKPASSGRFFATIYCAADLEHLDDWTIANCGILCPEQGVQIEINFVQSFDWKTLQLVLRISRCNFFCTFQLDVSGLFSSRCDAKSQLTDFFVFLDRGHKAEFLLFFLVNFEIE